MTKNNIYYTNQIDKMLSFLKTEVKPYETLKEIPETDGRYFISNRGRIVSLCRNEAHVLQPYIDSKGYQHVDLMIDGKRTIKRVHVLVAEAFMEKPEGEKLEVHHIDGNVSNNDISNLVFLPRLQHMNAHRILNQQKKAREKVQNVD